MERIPDEILAYLNKNLDLVTAHMHTHPSRYGTKISLTTYDAVAVLIHPDNNMRVVIIISHCDVLLGTYTYWRDLIQYVKNNNNNAPLALK